MDVTLEALFERAGLGRAVRLGRTSASGAPSSPAGPRNGRRSGTATRRCRDVARSLDQFKWSGAGRRFPDRSNRSSVSWRSCAATTCARTGPASRRARQGAATAGAACSRARGPLVGPLAVQRHRDRGRRRRPAGPAVLSLPPEQRRRPADGVSPSAPRDGRQLPGACSGTPISILCPSRGDLARGRPGAADVRHNTLSGARAKAARAELARCDVRLSPPIPAKPHPS